jgi:general secretion pathway protein C
MGAWLIMAVNGTLFGMCCFVVANVVTEIGSEALEPMPIAVASAPLEDDDETLRASPSLILERNLFGAQLIGDRQEIEVATDVPLATTKLPLKLLGTAAANVEDRSRAAIEDTKTKKHMVVAVGDTVEGHLRVRVKAIERTRVILDNAGRPEELVLNEKDALARSAIRPRRDSKRNRRNQTAEKKPTLNDRLEKLGGEEGIARVLSSARITPKYIEGEMAGMTVDSIKPDSLFEKIGFENGDIITEVNGIVIDRISATNAIFDELATADEIDTAVLRNGSAINLSADAEQLMEQR